MWLNYEWDYIDRHKRAVLTNKYKENVMHTEFSHMLTFVCVALVSSEHPGQGMLNFKTIILVQCGL